MAVVRASASEEPSTLTAHVWELPRCEQCASPLEFGLCDLCGQLFCLPIELSPFTRLALEPSPFVSEIDVLQAARRATAIWHPLKLHLMYQALSTQQRALIRKDADLLSSASGRMSSFKRWYLDPLLHLEGQEHGSSDDHHPLLQQLKEGAQVLQKELDVLPYSLEELMDVDAHQERNRLTSRLARFFHSYSSFLGLLMIKIYTSGQGKQASEPGEGHSETMHVDASLLLLPELSSMIDLQLSLLTQLEREVLHFERPTRPRWSAR